MKSIRASQEQTELQALQERNRLLEEAVVHIAQWPDGGNQAGQSHIKAFARSTLASLTPARADIELPLTRYVIKGGSGSYCATEQSFDGVSFVAPMVFPTRQQAQECIDATGADGQERPALIKIGYRGTLRDEAGTDLLPHFAKAIGISKEVLQVRMEKIFEFEVARQFEIYDQAEPYAGGPGR